MEEKILECIALREAIAQLTDREQMVIRRYFHGLTQDKRPKFSAFRRCRSRIEKKALRHCVNTSNVHKILIRAAFPFSAFCAIIRRAF
ncbi:MAG: hypothetical protein ACLSIR_01900 [Christensenellales bacterium]